MQTASNKSKIAGFTLRVRENDHGEIQNERVIKTDLMQLIFYACDKRGALNVPVSVHRLLQLVVEYKLWIPEDKEYKVVISS